MQRALQMPKRALIFGLVAAVPTLFSGCATPPEPVGSVTVSPAQIVLPFAGFDRVELNWQMDAVLEGAEGDLRVLLHLLDGEGELTRTFDTPFPGEWSAGGTATQEVTLYQSALGPALEGGDYRLTVGIYDGAGQRWPLSESGEEVNVGEYRAATVKATLRADDVPDLYFSEAWLPVEGGTDRQILGRRWLNGEGTIRLAKIQQDGTLWLRVGVPEGGRPDQDLVLAEGATQPVATVATACGEFSVELAGSGGHTVDVPIPSAGADGEPLECELTFTTNYELVSKTNRERRTIALEGLAWQ